MNEIRILSFFSPIPRRDDTLPREEPIVFRSGDILTGKVVRPLDSPKYFLQLNGRNLLVESRIPLPPGADLRFQVEEVQPKVTLRLLSPPTPEQERIYSLLRTYVSGDLPLEDMAEKISALTRLRTQNVPPALRTLLDQFQRLLLHFSRLSFFPPDPVTLKRLVEQSGFLWESKMKNWMNREGKKIPGEVMTREDLKGLISRLLEELKDLPLRKKREGEALEETRKGLELFLKKIELYQILNALDAAGPERCCFFLPLWLGGRLQFVELNLSWSKERPERKRPRELTVLLLLNLPVWGRIRIEIRTQDRELFCSLAVTDVRISEAIRPELPSLGERFQEMGYHPHFQMAMEETAQNQTSAASNMKEGVSGLLNRMVRIHGKRETGQGGGPEIYSLDGPGS